MNFILKKSVITNGIFTSLNLPRQSFMKRLKNSLVNLPPQLLNSV